MNRLLNKLNGALHRKLLVLLAAIFCNYPLHSMAGNESQRIHIVSSLSSHAQTEFIVALNNKLNLRNTQLTYSAPDKIPANGIDIYIIAGIQAALHAAEKLREKHVIYTLVSHEQFSSVRKNITRNMQIYRVLYIEQPYPRYLQVIKAVLPEARNIGFISSSTHRDEISTLTSEASIFGLSISSARVTDTNEAITQLARIVSQCDVLLATYDNIVYNRDSIKNILLTSYYGNIPIIGFSESFLHAGAYLSIYTSPAEYGAQTATLVEKFSPASTKQEFYPDRYTVKINQSIARTLSLPYYSSEEIARMLK